MRRIHLKWHWFINRAIYTLTLFWDKQVFIKKIRALGPQQRPLTDQITEIALIFELPSNIITMWPSNIYSYLKINWKGHPVPLVRSYRESQYMSTKSKGLNKNITSSVLQNIFVSSPWRVLKFIKTGYWSSLDLTVPKKNKNCYRSAKQT